MKAYTNDIQRTSNFRHDCDYCGRGIAPSEPHIHAKVRGKANTYHRLHLACWHQAKHTQLTMEVEG